MPLALILAPRRRSMVSSKPMTRVPAAANVLINKPSSTWAERQARPDCTTEHTMIVLKVHLATQAHDPQYRSDGALSRGKNASDQ